MHSKTITYCALFISLGILLPVIFHSIGSGPLFLPMFWPIAVSGFFLSPLAALTVGITTPVISTMITGMPPVPIVYKMIVELGILGWTVAIMRVRGKFGVLSTLAIGIAACEIVGFLGAAAFASLLGLPPGIYAAASLIKSLPGIICMLIFIPLLIKRIDSGSVIKSGKNHVY